MEILRSCCLLTGIAFASLKCQTPPAEQSSGTIQADDDQSKESNTDAATAEKPGGEVSAFSERLWISGQFNSITQFHPSFRAQYTGGNSTRPTQELASSRVLTLFTGFRINGSTELIFDIESAGGSSISSALGMAGYTNLDAVRNPTLGNAPYLARFMLRKIIALGKEDQHAAAGPLALAPVVPAHRVELRAGKLSTVDFFDVNSVGSDAHLQFMNWTVANNGAYDYAADTRGYTYGALIEYYDLGWAVRFMEALMPTVANGMTLDWDVCRARSENLEWELDHGLLPKRDGAIRILAFANHANMGTYRDAINDFLAGISGDAPDIIATRRQGTTKYGFGFNIEQELARPVRFFARVGWNEGRHESFVYTEVNRTAAAGFQWKGSTWKRSHDQIGVAAVWNGISGDHRRYLELGGYGFLLGDGSLNYARERILETYYRWSLGRGMSISADLQRVVNPGYNQDRGPVLIASGRFHIDIDQKSFSRKEK